MGRIDTIGRYWAEKQTGGFDKCREGATSVPESGRGTRPVAVSVVPSVRFELTLDGF